MERARTETYLEVIRPLPQRSIRVALFDFDGTLSLIRRGWQKIMISFMVDLLDNLEKEAERAELESYVEEYVAQLTGKQTIYQMIRLTEEIKKRGGEPLDPVTYKHEYHRRLWARIERRIEALRGGAAESDDWLVPGSRSILEALVDRGVKLYLASGTDESYVIEEARLLEITKYFQGIYGALDEYKKFSKKLIIDRVLGEEDLKAGEFLSFGDGYVEIENTREVGGIAVGVATDEEEPVGCDQWKRRRLIEAGAHLIVPHFEQHATLLAYLFDGEDFLDS